VKEMNMAEKLWELANLIAGFAVAQALAMTYAVVKNDVVPLRTDNAHVASLALICVFTVFYGGAIVLCCAKGRALDGANGKTWTVAKWGRVIALLLFQGVLSITVYGHWKHPGDYEPKLATPASGSKPVEALPAQVR
jgi:hypothetical protein